MSHPPDPVLGAVREVLAGRDEGGAVRAAGPVGGGCINPSARLESEGGGSWFLKWNGDAPAGMMEAEAEGLGALAAAAGDGGLRVPAVVGRGVADGVQWLLLDFVERGRPAPDYQDRLGRGLARLHGAAGPVEFGWDADNFIGSLPQSNEPSRSWTAFWRDRRLAPQLERARAGGWFAGRAGEPLDRLLDRMDEALAEAGGRPELLHGDLWSGNVYPGPDGAPVLVDPAAYRGRGEVDLAMSELFGGFPPRWIEAYREVRPVDPAYPALLRPVYQLYYLLVHVNLFGSSYVDASVRAAGEALAALG